MTYARARLWLGIGGVGTLVLLAAYSVAYGLPHRALSVVETDFGTELIQLVMFTSVVLMCLMPFDLMGGFWVPRRFGKLRTNFLTWFRPYSASVLSQLVLFVAFGLLILVMTRTFGVGGALLAISLGTVAGVLLRHVVLRFRRTHDDALNRKLAAALALVQSWQIFVPKTMVVEHNDIGFTGGIIGFGNRSTVVIPSGWFRFSTEQLSMAIARRALAIESGSYRRGLIAAIAWNVVGFFACSLIASANLTTVAGLATTVCWFTLWSFFGLLLLPTFSRKASHTIDDLLIGRGAPRDWVLSTAWAMDQLQDGEAERPQLIETIFHPIPSVARRTAAAANQPLATWNVARATLVLSWACLGFLSRAVHCNVGRPELWTMLPSD